MGKKLNLILAIILIPFSLYALMTHGGTNNRYPPSIGQTVYGYIDTVFFLEVSEPEYGGNGLNLDVMDPTNLLRYQIAPSQQGLTLAGAKIGSFSVITSDVNKKITITHTPLILDTDVTVTVDWELAVGWELNTIHKTAFCLSTSDAMSDASRKIEIYLNESGSDVIRLHDAYLYFRLSSTSPVTEAGQYHASVIFEVEDL